MNPLSFENVFISGGAGFIGSHLARRLLGKPSVQRVVIFDNFSSGQESYLAGLSDDPRLKIARGDLKEVSAVTAAMPALTASLALDLAPIRVNLIAPGFVDTPLSARLLGDGLV